MCHTLSFHHVKANDISARLHMSVIANKCYSVSTELCVCRLTGLHNFTICIHIKCTSHSQISAEIPFTYTLIGSTRNLISFRCIKVFYEANMRKNTNIKHI